jgi:hypothetical protein
MGEHPHHACPNCGAQAPRQWNGAKFGFDFAEGKTPGNSGVSKDDYPTADQAVGKSAEARWAEYDERAKVKEKVREVGGHRALARTHGDGNRHIEYTSGGEELIKQRKELAAGVNRAGQDQAEPGR